MITREAAPHSVVGMKKEKTAPGERAAKQAKAAKATKAVANSRPGRSTRRALAPHWPELLFVAVALIFFAITWPTMSMTHHVIVGLVPILSMLATWPIATIRYLPFGSWAVVAFSCLVIVPAHSNPDFALGWPVTFHLALAITLAAVVLTCDVKRVGIAVAVTAALQLLGPRFDIKIGWFFGALMFAAVIFLIRWLVVSRRQLATSNVQLAQESARSEAQSDLRIVAEERNKLARDLHDVVAHQMSMIVVQAQSAPYRLQGVTPGIHAEFDTLAETARSALDEVRSLLGVLRTDAETTEVAPVGADQILPTLTTARRSGVDISWNIDGDLESVDETTGVVLHRVLQESLSNAARHAPGGPVVVNLDIDRGPAGEGGQANASLEVDNGPAAPGALISPGSGGGSGIPGMSARVQAVGGAFSALSASDGGFTVTARVPFRGRAR